MPLDYRGHVTLGECVPLALRANAELGAAVSASQPDLQARVNGLLSISVRPPPSLADLIASVQALLAALQELAAAPLPDVDANAAALAELQAQLGALQVSLQFSLDFGALLGTPGVHYYAYLGRADGFGAALGAHVGSGLSVPPSAQIAAAALLASDGGATTALRALFGL